MSVRLDDLLAENGAIARRLEGFEVRPQQVEMADPDVVAETTGAPMGFAGPVGLKARMVADHAVKGMMNFVTGGNAKDLHLKNVNLVRDFTVEEFGDLRVIMPRDACPRCEGEIQFIRGIEVGHIFKLGTKYSDALKALFLDQAGKEEPVIMGCYGIGITRTAAAAIEQHNDKDGIAWPISIAPFEVHILPTNMSDPGLRQSAEEIYAGLRENGIEVLLDDRDERPGNKFKDADLVGVPVRVTVGEKAAREGKGVLR